MYWKKRFYFLKWFSLAVAVPLAASNRWIPSAIAFFFGLIAYSNAWNLGRFIRAETIPDSASRTIGESMKRNVSVALVGAAIGEKSCCRNLFEAMTVWLELSVISIQPIAPK
jgi:hypothetical protein